MHNSNYLNVFCKIRFFFVFSHTTETTHWLDPRLAKNQKLHALECDENGKLSLLPQLFFLYPTPNALKFTLLPFERKTSANPETGMAHFSIMWQGTTSAHRKTRIKSRYDMIVDWDVKLSKLKLFCVSRIFLVNWEFSFPNRLIRFVFTKQ